MGGTLSSGDRPAPPAGPAFPVGCESLEKWQKRSIGSARSSIGEGARNINENRRVEGLPVGVRLATGSMLVMTRSSRFAGVVRGAVARRGAALMGICNVTPDSFSDGGRFLDSASRRARVDELIARGGGHHRHRRRVDASGQRAGPAARSRLERVLAVVRYAAARGACVSIDTTSAEVAAACLDAGAHAVNDVSLPRDDELARVVAGSGACLVLSHARAPQEQMRASAAGPLTRTATSSRTWSRSGKRAAARAGRARRAARRARHGSRARLLEGLAPQLRALRARAELVAAVGEVPVLFGASRKSFLTLVDARRRAHEHERHRPIVTARRSRRRSTPCARASHPSRSRRARDAAGDRHGGRPRDSPEEDLMLEGLRHLFAARPILQVLVDVADILVVTYVVYRALLVLRGTRAMQMGTGLGVIFLVYVVVEVGRASSRSSTCSRRSSRRSS